MCILEATDEFYSIESVAAFMGAIVDLCFDLVDSPVEKTYAWYVGIFNFVHRDLMQPGWYGQDFLELQPMITSFKRISHEPFKSYQTSGMETSRWHSLHHLVQDLRDVGGVEGLHGGIYVGSHKLFENEYSRTSTRSSVEME